MENILLVEDEAILAVSESAILRGFGYQVQTLPCGEAAIKAIHEGKTPIDLILMDIDLGRGMDGTEAAKLILKERNLPIVFLTSHSERECVEKVKGITRYGYVIKNSGDFVLQSSIEMAFELFEAHEKMRMSETRLSALLKTIPDLVWLKDAHGVYLACNHAFETFFGAKEAEILGKTDYDFLDEGEADFFREKDLKALALGRPNRNEEWITYASDGHRAFLETIKTPMIDASGKLVGVLGIGRDITERAKMEEALKESERSVRRKLDAIIEPEGDLGELSVPDIVDIATLDSLMESFSALTGMTVAILDTKGKILIAKGWQDICTKFHRVWPASAAACTESDLFLSSRLKPGEYVDYRCRNNLWDIVTPLYIESRHIGNIFAGQYFYDDDVVDKAYFAAQAIKYGFDEEAYLEALGRVPRYSRAEIGSLMAFLVGLTEFVSRLGYSNLSLARTITSRKRVEELLSRSVDEKERLLKELQHRVKNSLEIVSSLLRINMADLRDEYSIGVFQEAVDRIRSVAMIYEKLSESTTVGRVQLGAYLSDLVDLLCATYATNADSVAFASDLGDREFDLKRAVPLGLILNELFTNAVKYGRPKDAALAIRVDLRAKGSFIELGVTDSGPGLPPGLDLANTKSFGLRISRLLVADLEGELGFAKSEDGHQALVRFPEESPRNAASGGKMGASAL